MFLTLQLISLILICSISYVYLQKKSSKTVALATVFLTLIATFVSNFAISILPHPQDTITLTAHGEKNTNSTGYDIVIRHMNIDGITSPISFKDGLWTETGGTYVWRIETDSRRNPDATREITINVPYGENRELVFINTEWAGIFDIEQDGKVQTIDLYTKGDSSDEYIKIEDTSTFNIMRYNFLKLLIWFLVSALLLLIYRYSNYIFNAFIKIIRSSKINYAHVFGVTFIMVNIILHLINAQKFYITSQNISIIVLKLIITSIITAIFIFVKKRLDTYFVIKLNNKILCITFIQFILSFVTDRIFFNTLSISEKLNTYLILKCVFLVSVYYFWKFIFDIPKLLKDPAKKVFIRTFFVYFAICILHTLITWPGITRSTDNSTLMFLLENLDMFYWHHYLTSAYHAVLLMFIPFVGGISICQVFIYSLIVAYATQEFFAIFNNAKKSYLIFVVWLFPPVLYFTNYMLRLNAIGFLETILLIIILKLLYKNNDLKNIKACKLCVLSLSAVMLNWRSEAIFYAILIPIFIFIWNYERPCYNYKKIINECALFFIMSLLLMVPQNSGLGNSSGSYQLTGVREGLHYLYNNVDDITSDPLNEIISKNINIEVLQSTPDGDTAFSHKDIYLGDKSGEMYDEVKSASMDLIIKHPIVFLKGRFEWLGKFLFEPYVLEPSPNNGGHIKITEHFDYTENIFDSIYSNLRFKYIDTLKGTGAFSNIIKHTWSLLIPIVSICVYFTYFILNLKTKWREFLVILIPCFRIAAVFLLSPGARFMYYFPAFLVGWLLFILWICKVFEMIPPKELSRKLGDKSE